MSPETHVSTLMRSLGISSRDIDRVRSGHDKWPRWCFAPFTAVKVEEMFSEDDCFTFKVERIPYYGPEVLVFTRQCGKVKRVYRLSQKPQKYMAKRYFLPADKETFNPHYLLMEDKE